MNEIDDAALHVQIEQSSPVALVGAFRCAAGEMLALVGPSGAGKTSMLRLLAGLTRPATGVIRVGKTVWNDSAKNIFVPPQRRHVGLVFQNYALMPHLSGQDNVALSLLHLPNRERARSACRWLDHMLMSRQEQQRRPSALSGGQQQRVAIARALAGEPKLLLLDEPFSAVDQMSRHGLYRLLAELRRDLAIPIVLVTHDLQEARMLCDSVVVMDAGKTLQQGTPQELHLAPRSARVAELIGLQNRFTGTWLGPAPTPGYGLLRWTSQANTADNATVFTVPVKREISTGQVVDWVIPSDGIALKNMDEQRAGQFVGRVCDMRFLGEVTLVSVAVEALSDVELVLTLAGPQRWGLHIGKRMSVALNHDLVHVMPGANSNAISPPVF